MNHFLVLVFVGCASLTLVASKPTGDDFPDPADRKNFRPVHTPDTDHEAFLGKEEAERFDQLTHEEARRRLGMIVDKIDTNKDGFVSEVELEEWVRHVSSRYVADDVERQWPYHDSDGDGKITMEEYTKGAYGESIEDTSEIYDHHRHLTYAQIMDRDQRRFKAADENGDGTLDKREFGMFLHPEEASHMRDIVVDETVEDMDKDKDGYVTVDEYINDLWPAYERKDGEEEPQWVKMEREQFGSHRDKDNNGKLDKEEIAGWILPEGFNHAKAEASHLVYEADADKDKKLTKEEVLAQQDLFVGSQATDFGEYLVRHDEF